VLLEVRDTLIPPEYAGALSVTVPERRRRTLAKRATEFVSLEI
jgi:hypothetical protein